MTSTTEEEAKMTVIQNMMSNITRGLEALPPECFHFLLQEALLVVAPALVCGVLYEMKIRIVPLQVSLLIIIDLAIMNLHVDHLEIVSGMARLYTLVLSVLILMYGPRLLCWYVVPTPRGQAILALWLYVGLVILLLAQILEIVRK